MKSGIPWNLKGVDEETRLAVAAAARKAGMSVGDWLNLVLADEGTEYAEPEEVAPPAPASRNAAEVERLIADLSERIGRIERQAPAPSPPAGVREMVANLARQIETTDEHARQSVEGVRRQAAAPEPRVPVRDTRRVDEAMRELDERVAAMGRRPAPAPQPEPRLEDIRAQLNTLLAQAPKPAARVMPEPVAPLPNTALLDAALQALESRIEDAKSRMTARAAENAEKSTAAQLARLEEKLADIASRLAAGVDPKAKKEGELAAAIREIAGRQKSIDDRAETFAIRRDQKALGAAIAALRADINALGQQMGSIARLGAEEQGTFFDLARRIEAIATEKPMDRSMLAQIRADLDAMKRLVDGAARQETLGTIEERSSEMARQISDLMLRTPDRERIDALSAEIAAIRAAMERDDSPRAIQRLEMRLSELGRTIEATLAARSRDRDPAIERLETRLNEITNRLVGSLMETTSHTSALEHRLEGRLNDIADRIGSLAAGQHHTAAIEAAQRQLEARMEEIAARLSGLFDTRPEQAAIAHLHDRLQAIADRMDALNDPRREPSAALDTVQAEIRALRAEIAAREAPAAAATDHLEEQIRILALQLETVASSPAGDGPALVQLEEQVARLAAELEQARPKAEAIHNVEASLDRLQAMLASNAEESIATARAEARKAVNELNASGADSSIDARIIEGLVRDLETLKAAAATSEAGAQPAVGATMAKVVNRLSQLENEASAATAEPQADTGRSAWSFRGGMRMSKRKPQVPVRGPAIEPEHKTPADRRADFIAAARRAAQAAARETQATNAPYAAPEPQTPATATPDAASEEAAARKPGAFARISQAIRSRKRPLLLAAAAIVLAIGAMQVYGHLSTPSDAGQETVALTVPTVEPTTNQFGDIVPPAAIDERAVTGTVASRIAVPSAPPAAAPTSELAFAEPEGFDNRFAVNTTVPGSGTTGFSAPAAAPSSDAEEFYAEATLPAVASVDGLDPRLGDEKLLTAARNGEPAAAFEIATRYADGTRVPKDLGKAVEWYTKAAEGGVAVAQYRLGSLYERGQGVKKDLVRAVNWYQRAADQGNVNAMHNLAVLMSEGVEGDPDHNKALQWFLAAGNYGVRDSQYNLGVIYARGLGPQQDLVESYKWFAVAAAQGDTDAATRRDEVAKALSPDDLAKARAVVSAWHVKAPIAEANGVVSPPGGWDGPGQILNASDRDNLVAKIQALLAERGFDPGPADGKLGPKTVDAVRAYQRLNGQPETGQIDSTLVAALTNQT